MRHDIGLEASTTCCAHSRAKNRVEGDVVGWLTCTMNDREAAGAAREFSGHMGILLKPARLDSPRLKAVPRPGDLP